MFLNGYILAAMDEAEEGEGLAQREAGVERFRGSGTSGLSGHLLIKYEGAHGHRTVTDDRRCFLERSEFVAGDRPSSSSSSSVSRKKQEALPSVQAHCRAFNDISA